MQWKAATDRVLVQREVPKTERKTDAGIVLPNQLRGECKRGTVLASGPQAVNVLPGDTVIYEPKYAKEIETGIDSIDANGILAIQRED